MPFEALSDLSEDLRDRKGAAQDAFRLFSVRRPGDQDDLSHDIAYIHRAAIGEPWYFSDDETLYTNITVRKGRKTRDVLAPMRTLKKTQRLLLPFLTSTELPDYVYGFREGMDSVRGLRHALGSFREKNPERPLRAVFNTDIRNFFPTIKEEQVWKTIHALIHENGFSAQYQRLLTSAVTALCTHKGRLPQGAPTSPAIANLIGTEFDEQIHEYTEKELGDKTVYMRYADDISLLSAEEIPEHVRSGIATILKTKGFVTAPEKTTYSFNEKYNSLLGLHIPKHEEGPVRFRIRPLTQRRWIDSMRKRMDLRFYLNASMKNKGMRRILGRLGYTAYVGMHGHDEKALAEGMWLPKEMGHAWEKFSEYYRDVLPKGSQNWYRREPRVSTDTEPIEF